MAIVSMHEAKANLSCLLDEVQKGGEIVIARGNIPVARLVPYDQKRPVRRPGYLKGKIRIATDFDASLPDETFVGFMADA